MSIQAVSWVLEHSRTRGAARLALISIANYADRNTGECFPSMRTIAREAGCSPGSVPPSVREAVRLGELVVIDAGGPHARARYRMTFATVGVQSLNTADRVGVQSDEVGVQSEGFGARQPGLSPAQTPTTISEPLKNPRTREADRMAEALGLRQTVESPPVDHHHPDDDERARVRATHLADARARVGLNPNPAQNGE